MKSKASAIIPAYNEERRVGKVANECLKYVEEVIVVDDGSSDRTTEEAKKAGAKVIKNEETKGYLGAIRTGFRKAYFDIIVTLDADGEHSPTDIPRLLEPIVNGRADLLIGKRERPDRVQKDL
jgi:glycosyltransferase involved in cell wall biosynthesis